MSRFIAARFPYQVTLERFLIWESDKISTKPKKSIQEGRKARRKLMKGSTSFEKPIRKNKSMIILKPESDSFGLHRKESCPNLYMRDPSRKQDEPSLQKEPKKAFTSSSDPSLTGRKFELLRESANDRRRCCCSEHVILNLDLRYRNSTSFSSSLKKLCDYMENVEGISMKTELKKKSQSLLYLPVCDPKCLERHHIVEEKPSFIKRIKHFICCCVQKSKSHTNLNQA